MILLTGATDTVGAAVLRRLIESGHPVRCLVRDPSGLGAERVRVQLALGDPTTGQGLRNALRGVRTVVHLAAPARDEARATVEELNGLATLRLVRATERAEVEAFVALSSLGASLHSPSRWLRARAVAEAVIGGSSLRAIVLAPSLVYAPGDRLLRALDRLSRLPAVPLPGSGRALHQPIAAEDVAACALAALDGDAAGASGRLELGGPELLDLGAIVATALAARGRRRPTLTVPCGLAARGLRGLERLAGPEALVPWTEAEVLATSTATERGTTDAERLGVSPRSLRAALASDPGPPGRGRPPSGG